jgi:hypothetical protein
MSMKYKIVHLFFLLFLSPLLHSMEYELVPFLDKKTVQYDVNLQEDKDSRRALVTHVFHKLFLLKRVVWMPNEIWQQIHTKAVEVMFEGDKEFEKNFYSKPIAEALELYHTITKTVGRDKPIAPLFKVKQEDRDVLLHSLKKVNPWYGDYIDPIISSKEQQHIYELNPEFRQYFSGKNVRVFSECQMNRHSYGAAMVGGGCFMHGVNCVLCSASCCISGVKIAYSLSNGPLGALLGVSCLGCLLSSAGLCCLASIYCDQSNKVTL